MALGLRAGDLVEVRSRAEILETLDSDGRLEGLPFMPQMLEYCGRRFRSSRVRTRRVTSSAGEGRRLVRCVHLDVRCDGKAYGGCQAACLIFWKEDWLKRARRPDDATRARRCAASRRPHARARRSRDRLARDQKIDRDSGEPVYMCQATRVPDFTQPLAWWDPRQYIADWRSGNVTLGRLMRGLLFQTYSRVTQAREAGVGRPGRWIYDCASASNRRHSVPHQARNPRARGTESHRGARPSAGGACPCEGP